MTQPLVVAALYKFAELDDYAKMREPLLALCNEQGICGTLLLAPEGINGTIAGTREGVDAVLAYLHADPRFAALEHKESSAEVPPFKRMKVKLKKEIVTLGVEGVDPTQRVGVYVDPKDWNQLITDPEVVVIDVRNAYEIEAGTFQNAQNPGTRTFREFPAYVKANLDPARTPKAAMYCTGGIRCEKASAFMLEQGFGEVYHLKGGILKYLEEVEPSQSLWQGECFVFDERAGLDHEDF